MNLITFSYYMPIQLLETYIRKVTTFAKLIKIILSNTPKSSFFQIKQRAKYQKRITSDTWLSIC